jgi:hypothetical protein
VLFEQRFWPGIRDGSVTRTYRRWKRQQVLAGRRYRTPGGIVEVESVDVVDPASITKADARRSGYADADTLRGELRGTDELPTYRIVFHLVDEPDPRAELAANDELTDDDVAAIDRRLARLDQASSHGPWTTAYLDVIWAHPATRAADLAVMFGREIQPFKTDIRKLKNLGLTLSLERGYRLSPRGIAYRARRGPRL